jgi:cyanophycinase
MSGEAVRMRSVYLIGGGRGEDGVRASHEPFVRAVGGRAIVAFVLDEGEDTDVDRWTGSLRAAGSEDVRAVVVSGDRPPARADVGDAGGVFVAGGWTPGYQEAFAASADWLPDGVVYGGFSAGAAIAGEWAIVGGWRLGEREVCAEEAGEDLEQLTVRPGLGLVPFAVDVHATQWGTLTRLAHAVRAGLAPDGWAIDEGTVLVYDGDRVTGIEGLGSAYRVTGGDGDLRLEVVTRASP